jgi:glycosyltransferase involved in cell wall biosynthesis
MSRLVSVIMPCFNAGRMLRPALRSVLLQTHPELEVVFIDNNSTDGSAETARAILTDAGRPFILLTCAEQGANNARNLGYTVARGDFIQWMDADDQLHEEKIARQVAVLEANPRDDIAYGDWSAHRMTFGKPDIVDHIRPGQVDDQILRTLAGVWYPPHSYLPRRAAADRLQAAHGWWPERKVATDVEYSALAALLGLRFRYVAGARVRYNIWSDGQISNATPYPRRVAALRSIFERLGRFVEDGHAALEPSARHKVLLHLGWDVLRVPVGSISVMKLPGRHFTARRTSDGHQITLRPREAAIVRLMTGAIGLVPLHHALALERRIPEFAGDFVAIAKVIEMLRREGMLERVDIQRGT